MAVSNGIAFDVRPDVPAPGTGFVVKVVDWADFDTYAGNRPVAPLAVFARYEQLSFSPELGRVGVGAGSITLDLDDPVWDTTLANGYDAQYLRNRENLFVVYENGTRLFEFLCQSEEMVMLDGGRTGRRGLTLSGPGTADVLRRGKIMTPNWPEPPPLDTPPTYQFGYVPKLSVWLAMLRASQLRGAVQYVTPLFTADHDSIRDPWSDSPADPVADAQALAPKNATDPIQFPAGSAALDMYSRAAVAQSCAKMDTRTPPTVTIVGHTSSVGTKAANKILGQQRADAVAAEVRRLLPDAKCKISTSSAGESKPIAKNDTAAGRKTNDRAMITYPVKPLSAPIVYEPVLGGDLLDLLREMCSEDLTQLSPVRAEWIMRPGFRLYVVDTTFEDRQIGRHREADVIFFEGSQHMQAKTRSRRRRDIANVISVQNASGYYTVATSILSVNKWGRREHYYQAGSGFDFNDRSGIANHLAGQLAGESTEWTITVPYDGGPGRRFFRDYNIGDWIGIAHYNGTMGTTVEAQRVHAATVTVDAAGTVSLELTLQTARQSRLESIQRRLTSYINHVRIPKVWLDDPQPVNARPGDWWVYNPPRFLAP